MEFDYTDDMNEITGYGGDYERACRTAVQAALQFCLTPRAAATVIPGMLTVQEVEENVAASDCPPLSPEELAKIYEVYAANEFFERP